MCLIISYKYTNKPLYHNFFRSFFLSRTHVIKIHSADFNYKGYTHHASTDDPQYAIQSDKTDHIAVHKGKALTKLNK